MGWICFFVKIEFRTLVSIQQPFSSPQVFLCACFLGLFILGLRFFIVSHFLITADFMYFFSGSFESILSQGFSSCGTCMINETLSSQHHTSDQLRGKPSAFPQKSYSSIKYIKEGDVMYVAQLCVGATYGHDIPPTSNSQRLLNRSLNHG